MNYPENTEKAANYLKQAVPYMVKNKMPANPINYSLWYNYVGNRIPALNKSLDRILEKTGICSSEQSQELYFNYIIGEHLKEHNQTLEGITKLAAQILHRLENSTTNSQNFNQKLNDNIGKLKNAKTVGDITEIISNVISTSEDIRSANNVFGQQIKEATSEIASLRHQLQQAEKHASIDQLTQLYNRRSFDQQLKELLQNKANAHEVCLILADIDHFKVFNDHYGHVIGDRVLKRTGQLIQNHCPDNAIAARYGGEEFAIIVTNTTMKESIEVAENLRRHFQRLRVKTKSSNKTLDNISASFGIANFEIGESLECFIDRADQALYRAKHKGRNRVEVHVEAVTY